VEQLTGRRLDQERRQHHECRRATVTSLYGLLDGGRQAGRVDAGDDRCAVGQPGRDDAQDRGALVGGQREALAGHAERRDTVDTAPELEVDQALERAGVEPSVGSERGGQDRNQSGDGVRHGQLSFTVVDTARSRTRSASTSTPSPGAVGTGTASGGRSSGSRRMRIAARSVAGWYSNNSRSSAAAAT